MLHTCEGKCISCSTLIFFCHLFRCPFTWYGTIVVGELRRPQTGFISNIPLFQLFFPTCLFAKCAKLQVDETESSCSIRRFIQFIRNSSSEMCCLSGYGTTNVKWVPFLTPYTISNWIISVLCPSTLLSNGCRKCL